MSTALLQFKKCPTLWKPHSPELPSQGSQRYITIATLILSATSCPVQNPLKYYPPTDHFKSCDEIPACISYLCPTYTPFLPHSWIIVIFSQRCTLWNLLCSVHQPPITSSLPGRNTRQYPVQHLQSVCTSQCERQSFTLAQQWQTVNNILLHLRQSYVSLVVSILLLLITCCPFRCHVYSANVNFMVISNPMLITCTGHLHYITFIYCITHAWIFNINNPLVLTWQHPLQLNVALEINIFLCQRHKYAFLLQKKLKDNTAED